MGNLADSSNVVDISKRRKTSAYLYQYADSLAEDLDEIETALVIADNDASETGMLAIQRAREHAAALRHAIAGMRADAEGCEAREGGAA